ncbi:MAG: iron ABC transporter permease [Spirochaetales bacterium]|nr:iron ABC transporter permease [Spirochaetales bacterium]
MQNINLKITRAKNTIKNGMNDPTTVIMVILVVVLAYLVIAPIGSMVINTFTVGVRDSSVSGGNVGDITGAFYKRVFNSRVSSVYFYKPLMRTLFVAIMVSIIAIPLGGLLAWFMVKTDLPGKKWMSSLMMLPYIMPSWTFAVVWLTIFKNRRLGGSAGVLESFGFTSPDWLAYGAFPIIICEAFHLFPFAYSLFSNSLKSMDIQLEESARIVGAPRSVITRRIILPLMLPATLSAFLLIFTRVIGSFGTPYILGTGVKYTILPTSLYAAFRSGETGVTAVIAVCMILVGVMLISLDSFLLKDNKRFVTIGIKGSIQRLTPLGIKKPFFVSFVLIVLCVTIFIPLFTLVTSTLTILPGVLTKENLTLVYWIGDTLPSMPGQLGLLRNPDVLGSVVNSLKTAVAAAVLSGFVGIFIGYVVIKKSHSMSGKFLKQISFMPYLVPSIAFAAANISLFAVRRGPVPALYGSMMLVVIVMAVKYLPYASRSGIAAMMQLGNDPEEAAQICGAPWRKRITRIVVPIMKGSLVGGIMLPFITAMKEQSLVIMLATPGTELMTTQVLRYTDYGYMQLANGVVLMIVILIIVFKLVIEKLTGAQATSGLGR